LHIAVAFKGVPRSAEIEKTLDMALDWMRYAPNCWLVYTNSSPQKWFERIHLAVKPDESVFIVKVDIKQRQGRLPKWAWDWMNQPRERRDTP
jgi:hypothetical protein